MRLFSARNNKTTSVKKSGTGKKVLIVAGVMMALFMAGPIAKSDTGNNMFGMTAYAAEVGQQTPNWFQDTNGTWKVRDGAGNIVANCWFCDLDGSWYLMDENGCMREGIINDGGHYYSLETSHAGHYGMMRTTNGVYDGVNLVFNQEHNGFYGEILSGANELINTGVKVTPVSGLPANSVYAKDFGNTSASVDTSVDVNQQQQQQAQQQQATDNQKAMDKFANMNSGSLENGAANLSPEEQERLDRALDNFAKHKD